MVRVTDRAVTALQDILTDRHAPPEAGIRLTPDGSGGLGMTVDAPVDGDEVIERDESCVLIVDGAIKKRMGEMVVDYQSAEPESGQTGERQFVLRPPQDGDSIGS
jgi:Fe-S cluster assembly iron-binding protein IscA